MGEIKPPFVSKLNTALQLLLMSTTLIGDIYGFLGHPLMEVMRFSMLIKMDCRWNHNLVNLALHIFKKLQNVQQIKVNFINVLILK